LESNPISYGHAIAYLPVIELLKHFFKVNVHDSIVSIREKVTSTILTLDPSLQDAIPPVLDLLDSLDDRDPFRSLDTALRRQCTYQAVIRLLLSESHVQPVIAVFEDLHFNDSLTVGLLNELVVAAQNARLLLVISYRPEYRDEWRNRPGYHRLRLDPLAGGTLVEFDLALLGSDPSLHTLKSLLAERANGNPFFVEEIVRSLVDTGVLVGQRGGYRIERPLSSVEVPPTVQSVLAARIDALPVAQKLLLQEAAVIGHDIPFSLLHAISGLTEDRVRGLLDNLQAAEFLYPIRIFPDLRYTFKHSLTHDVTYNGMLRERRCDAHARVGDAIEQLYADRLDEHVERLAYHAMRGEKREKAVRYLGQAGAKAAARSALTDARACFELALNVLEELPESRVALEQAFQIRLELRRILRQLGEGRKMLHHLQEAEVLAERLEDDRRRGQVYALMTTVLSSLDELDDALVTGSRALEIAGRVGELELGIVARSNLQQVRYYRGEYRHVLQFTADNLGALSVGASQYFGMGALPSVFGRAYPIMSFAEIGLFTEAAKYAAEAIRIAEPTEHPHTMGWAYYASSMVHVLKGDWVKARSSVEHGMAMLRTGNVADLLPWAVAASAWVLAQLGEISEALNRVDEAKTLLEQQAKCGLVGCHCGWAYHAVSHACLLLGWVDEARRLGACAVESSRRQPGSTAHALHLLGDIATHPERFDVERGAAHYRQALVLAQAHSMRPLVAHCYLGLGKLYHRIGETEHARENFTTATTMYREMEISFWLDQGRRYDEL
jgi:tetratricopeptide (TPR) repeat protein